MSIKKVEALKFNTSAEVEEAISILRNKMCKLDIEENKSRQDLKLRFDREKKLIAKATAEVLDKQESKRYSNGKFYAVRYFKDRNTTDLRHSVSKANGCTCEWRKPVCKLCKATATEGEVVGYSLHLYVSEIKPAAGYAVRNSYKSEEQKFAIEKQFKICKYEKGEQHWEDVDTSLREATWEEVPATRYSKAYKKWSFGLPNSYRSSTSTSYNSLESMEKGIRKLGFPEDLIQAFVNKYKTALNPDLTIDWRPEETIPEDYYLH